MRLLLIVALVVVCTSVVGKGRGGKLRVGKSGGWFFAGKNKHRSGTPNYPRQQGPETPLSYPRQPGPETSNIPRPPAYNPGYNNGPPPAYSKNPPPNPQSGGFGPPPPYSQYSHYPSVYNQGNFPRFSSFPQYPQHYSGGYGPKGFGYPKRSGFGFPGIIPIPIPIPIGGGGFGFGSHGGGYYRKRQGSSEAALAEDDDSDERPRILVPPDFELEGVTELPGDLAVAQWDIVGREVASRQMSR